MARARHKTNDNVVQFPLVAIEDNFLNIQAVAKLMLFVVENSDDDQWQRAKDEFCTSLYMIREQCDTGHNTMSGIARRRLELKP